MRTALAAAVRLPLLVLLLLAAAPQLGGGSAALHSGGHGGSRRLQQASRSSSSTASAALRGESSLSPRLWPLPNGYLCVPSILNQNSALPFTFRLVICICTRRLMRRASVLHACRPMYRRVFRMVGRDIVRKRLAMEAGWHSWIAQVTGSGG